MIVLVFILWSAVSKAPASDSWCNAFWEWSRYELDDAERDAGFGEGLKDDVGRRDGQRSERRRVFRSSLDGSPPLKSSGPSEEASVYKECLRYGAGEESPD
ncbi:hypothetical protein EV361DRAFT_943385 [Lentinula raphanica]|nr:hypothetical protein EV361DRAFT_943385 [Lentinula raphanica]